MKNIRTFEEFVNESLNEAKVEIKLPDLPDGKVWRAVETFNAADLPWEKYADSWIGKFRKFNINTEGVQQYPKGRAIVIHTGGDYWVSGYHDSSSVLDNSGHNEKYNFYYSNKERNSFDDWRKKMIYMALEKGLVKMDSMNVDDRISLKWTEIIDSVGSKKKVVINGIEVLKWDNLKFDFNRGYLTVTGFNDEGKKEETLIRDLLKADVKIS